MDEADRPTDGDDSAGRDDRTDGASAEAGSDGSVEAERGPGEPVDADRDSDESMEVDRDSDEPEVESARSTGESGEAEAPPDASRAADQSAGTGSDGDNGVRAGVRSEGRSDPDRGGRGDAEESLWHRFRHDHDGALMWIRELLSSVGVVLLVGLLLFGVSGVWPPMVAVESGSMEPNMRVGDLVFVTEPGRLAPDAADNGVGVVTYEAGREVDYRTFGSYGSVMIYSPPGRTGSPIIHRAMFHVNEGENWYDRADARYHNAVDCESLANCPAPHDGYVTLGDNNQAYDQASGLSPPVRAEWVSGVARVRVPYLGYIRLLATGQVELEEALARTVGSGLPDAGSRGTAAGAESPTASPAT